MNSIEMLIIIMITGIATLLTRLLPFIIFSGNKPTPKYIVYLGKVLPAAIFGFLVIYSLKDVNILSTYHGIPELIAIISIILSYLWKKNTLISISVGTIVYMLLIQLVFVY